MIRSDWTTRSATCSLLSGHEIGGLAPGRGRPCSVGFSAGKLTSGEKAMRGVTFLSGCVSNQ
jgi:hypothetical protein